MTTFRCDETVQEFFLYNNLYPKLSYMLAYLNII